MRNAECGMGGRECPCAGIPCGQTRRRHGWPKREAPLRAATFAVLPVRESPADKPAADTVGRDVKRPLRGLPVRRETECPCARALSRRPPRACRFAEEQSALARRPAFRRAACAGIPSRQTRRRHGWPKREAPLRAATFALLPVRKFLVDKPTADTVVRNVKRLCAEIPCGQTRRRHGWPKREAPLCAASLSPGCLCGNPSWTNPLSARLAET